MIVKIENDLKFRNKCPFELERTDSQIKLVKENWNNFIQGKKDYYNGIIFNVTDIEKNIDNYTFEIGKANYEDFIYAKNNSDLVVNSLFVAILLKTKDDYYLLIKNNHNIINLIGGLASEEDFINEEFIPELCLERELKEEIGLNLKKKMDIMHFDRKYLKIPNKEDKLSNINPTGGVIYVGTLNYTKLEMNDYFKENKDTFDNEVKELLFFTKDNFSELNKIEKKIAYLDELISIVEKSDL